MSAEVFDRSFQWIADRADQFALGHARGRAKLTAVKRLAELATLASETLDLKQEAAGLLQFAWDETGRGDAFFEALTIEPTIAIAYLPFYRAGLRSLELEALLARNEWTATESWKPLKRYAIGFMLEALGIRPPWSTYTARAMTARSPWPFPLYVAVTAHVVMWRTVMGSNCAALASYEIAEIRSLALAWSARLIREGQLDPLAEVIIANACVHGVELADAWRQLARAQRKDGSIPPVVATASAHFEHVYHSTLVAALAAAVNVRTEKEH